MNLIIGGVGISIALLFMVFAMLPREEEFRDENDLDELLADLKSPVTDVQLNAIHQLKLYGPRVRSLAPQLVRLINSQSDEIQLAALQTLYPIGLEASKAVPLLLKACNYPSLEKAAIASLILYGDAAVPYLEQVTKGIGSLHDQQLQYAAPRGAIAALNKILECRSCGGTGKGPVNVTCGLCNGDPGIDEYGDKIPCSGCHGRGVVVTYVLEGSCEPCSGSGQRELVTGTNE